MDTIDGLVELALDAQQELVDAEAGKVAERDRARRDSKEANAAVSVLQAELAALESELGGVRAKLAETAGTLNLCRAALALQPSALFTAAAFQTAQLRLPLVEENFLLMPAFEHLLCDGAQNLYEEEAAAFWTSPAGSPWLF